MFFFRIRWGIKRYYECRQYFCPSGRENGIAAFCVGQTYGDTAMCIGVWHQAAAKLWVRHSPGAQYKTAVKHRFRLNSCLLWATGHQSTWTGSGLVNGAATHPRKATGEATGQPNTVRRSDLVAYWAVTHPVPLAIPQYPLPLRCGAPMGQNTLRFFPDWDCSLLNSLRCKDCDWCPRAHLQPQSSSSAPSAVRGTPSCPPE